MAMLKVVGASWLRTKISSYILGVLGILAILALFAGQMERIQDDGNYAATVFYSNKTGYRIEYWGQSNELADIPKGVARAYIRRDIDTTGWFLLEIETDGSFSDETQAYAAGILEGALTWYLIHTHLENTIRPKCEEPHMHKQCEKLRDALDKSVNTWKNKAAELGNENSFWYHVSLHYTQVSGIYTGWKHGVERSMMEYDTDISDLYWLNSWSETAELQRKLNISLEDPVINSLPGLSSAFLRIVNETTEDGSTIRKLYLAHNAAGSYASMTRILKRYKFNYHLTPNDPTPAPGTLIEFSSYPGSVTSQDEFYILRGENHSMAVTGTTLRNYNNSLWKEVDITEQIPVGPRISAANHLSSNVTAWAHTLAIDNSGTACKQWLVVDFNKIEYAHRINATGAVKNDAVTVITINNNTRHIVHHRNSTGLVWLIEQVPGRTHALDLSQTLLRQHYLATYGLPIMEDIANLTHVPKMEQLYGKVFSVTESPRAVTFKRGYKNATSLDSIIKLMRQNNVTAISNAGNKTTEIPEGKKDEVEYDIREDGYWSVLGVRGDMAEVHREPYGIIDTKVVSGTGNNAEVEFVAISSPPYTEVPNPNITIPVNKGNIASVYTDQFNDQATFDALEIRDLVKQQEEEAQQEKLEQLLKDVISPFQWSESDFKNVHEGLPDKWAFGPLKPNWSW